LGPFQAFFLGLVQGLTEFLPVSSSGHLVLMQRLFNIKEGALTFDIAVHLATAVAVTLVLWKDIWGMIKRPFSKLTLLVVVGTIPTGIIGLLFRDAFEGLYESGVTLGFEFILTGLILWYAESIRSGNKKLDNTGYVDAAVIGVAQGIAILPAISRSGLTLAGALFRGLNREFALKFSFLMSIPAILGAAVPDVLDIIKGGGGTGTNLDPLPLAIGMITAAVSGYLAVRLMLKIFAQKSLKMFSYYVFVLGALIILDQLVFGRFFPKLF